MSTDKPSRNEDEYFAREEHERLARLRAKEAADHGVQVERCPEDGGIWLDAGEIDLLMKHEDHSVLRRVFGDVAGSLRKNK